ncbi:MAG: DNA polymerase Y family protein [Planctomycetes bacterium]|nr:DNA polymerase Y family protein [Planctomycetota bacterium]
MKRVLSVYLPMWSINLARRRCPPSANPPEALLLTSPHAARELVRARCRAAQHLGVRIGMDVADARALIGPALRIEPHTPERNAAALRSLARWALRFSPRVAPDPPDGLLIDITGTQRLFRSERRLRRLVERALCSLGIEATTAAASTIAAAQALARFKPGAVIKPAEEREALSPLPLEALRFDPHAIDALHELNVTTIGQLLRLPRAALPGRFGADLLVRIDQALGVRDENFTPIRPPVPAIAEISFDGPTTRHEPIHAAARSLIDQLADIMHRRGVGARTISLTLGRADSQPLALTIQLSRPNRNPRHLWSLLRPHLERADIGLGVESLRLAAPVLARIRTRQEPMPTAPRAHPHGEPDQALGELADTLANRLGTHAVARGRTVNTHIPERAFVLEPVLSARRPAPHAAPPPPGIALRPTRLFDRPIPVHATALSPDGPVVRIVWQGRDEPVQSCTLPERIAPEWWRDPTAGVRDYFRIALDNGRTLWLFHEWPHNRWFIHGEWA